jgi:hypothetical protein
MTSEKMKSGSVDRRHSIDDVNRSECPAAHPAEQATKRAGNEDADRGPWTRAYVGMGSLNMRLFYVGETIPAGEMNSQYADRSHVFTSSGFEGFPSVLDHRHGALTSKLALNTSSCIIQGLTGWVFASGEDGVTGVWLIPDALPQLPHERLRRSR